MGTNELTARIKEYREYSRMIEEMEAIKSSIADELKALMVESGQSKMIVGEYKLSYTDVSRTDIDRKRLREEEEAIFDKYSYSTVYKRFLISQKKSPYLTPIRHGQGGRYGINQYTTNK